MISTEDEYFIWEELRDKVSRVLGEVEDGRSRVKSTWDEDTPSFDHLDHMLYAAHCYIEGRLQELEPQYSEWQAYGKREKSLAKKALSYGVNFQALTGLPDDEANEVLEYIKERGLASMSYEATRKALEEFWVKDWKVSLWG